METLVWMRVPGDILFGFGAILLALFMARLIVSARARQAPVLADPALVPAE
jgi:nitric oxide reductase subunit B